MAGSASAGMQRFTPVLESGVLQPIQDNDKAGDKEVSHVQIHYSTGGNLF